MYFLLYFFRAAAGGISPMLSFSARSMSRISLLVYTAKIGLEPALIDGADLLQQQRGIGAQHIGGYRHVPAKLFRLLLR